MPTKVKKILDEVSDLIVEIDSIGRGKNKIVNKTRGLHDQYVKDKVDEGDYKNKLGNLLKGKKEHEVTEIKDKQLEGLLKKLRKLNGKILENFKIENISESLGAEESITEFVKGYKEKKEVLQKVKFTTHQTNFYGFIANRMFKDTSKLFMHQYPEYFKELYSNLRISNLRVFSNTYVNMALLSGLLVFVFALLLNFSFGGFGILKIFRHIVVSILLGIFTLVGFYYYPRLIIDNRRRSIKNELPFALMHMAAIAGSGAELTSIFSFLLGKGEYKALSGEVKKIMNYVNLFGYNLSTALKFVSNTTPSPELKDLFTGMRNTIETGGDMKSFLKSQASDAMNNYRLDRKKYVETLSTYSDIYTAILIAAPLLFIIVLVLISLIGTKIGNVDIEVVEKLGIFVVVPALNIVFIVFLNIMQPEL